MVCYKKARENNICEFNWKMEYIWPDYLLYQRNYNCTMNYLNSQLAAEACGEEGMGIPDTVYQVIWFNYIDFFCFLTNRWKTQLKGETFVCPTSSHQPSQCHQEHIFKFSAASLRSTVMCMHCDCQLVF